MGFVKGKIKNIKKRKNKLYKEYGNTQGLLMGISYVFYKIFTLNIIRIVKLFINNVKDDWMVFETKPDFADNGRALSDYLISNGYNRYKITWLVEEPENFKKYETKNLKFVRSIGKNHKQRTVKAYYYSLKSKYIFFTHSFKWVLKKPKNQLYINLWHGCGYKASRRDPNEASDLNIFDYCLVPGNVFIKTKAEFFICKEEQILPLGYPRYNLYKSDNKRVEEYFKSLGGNDRKNILWMPTFIQSKDLIYYNNPIPSIIGLPLINSILDLDKLEEICAKNNVNLIIKTHRIGSKIKNSDKVQENSHVFYLDNDKLEELEIQLYELISKSDALITDFSSVAIDYILLDKPMAFTLESIDDYAKTRGFVFDNPRKYMPGEHMYCFDDLRKFIENTAKGLDLCADKRSSIMDETHNRTDDYCKRILDYFEISC